jgi:hypothetical protein
LFFCFFPFPLRTFIFMLTMRVDPTIKFQVTSFFRDFCELYPAPNQKKKRALSPSHQQR